MTPPLRNNTTIAIALKLFSSSVSTYPQNLLGANIRRVRRGRESEVALLQGGRRTLHQRRTAVGGSGSGHVPPRSLLGLHALQANRNPGFGDETNISLLCGRYWYTLCETCRIDTGNTRVFEERAHLKTDKIDGVWEKQGEPRDYFFSNLPSAPCNITSRDSHERIPQTIEGVTFGLELLLKSSYF